jgi:hypothetical protein
MSSKLLSKAQEENIIEPIVVADDNVEMDDLDDDFFSKIQLPAFVQPLDYDNSLQNSTCEDGLSSAALKYLAGYVGFLVKKSGGTDFGEITRRIELKIPENLSILNITDLWIHSLSRGGLIYPSENLLNIITQLETEFTSRYPGTELTEHEKLSAKIINELCSRFPSVDKKIVKYFVKVRINIRVKYLNYKEGCKNLSKRNVKKAKMFSKAQIVVYVK